MPAMKKAEHKFRPWMVAVLLLALLAGLGWFTQTEALWTWDDLHRLLNLPLETAALPAGEEPSAAVTFLDVGQGDAVLLQSGGQSCLVDAGHVSAAQDLLRELHQQDLQALEYLVLTHPDADHIGGALSVLRQFPVGEILVPSTDIDPEASGWQDDILWEAQRQDIPVTAVQAGDAFPLGEGTITILLADYPSGGGTNDRSVCLRFAAGSFSFLDTGDAEQKAEAELVRLYGEQLCSTVMKAGHHGSSTSNSRALLQVVRPQAVGISCGAGNDYGHPHRETLETLAEVGAQVFRTDQLGTFTIIWDTEGLHLPVEEAYNEPAAA